MSYARYDHRQSIIDDWFIQAIQAYSKRTALDSIGIWHIPCRPGDRSPGTEAMGDETNYTNFMGRNPGYEWENECPTCKKRVPEQILMFALLLGSDL